MKPFPVEWAGQHTHLTGRIAKEFPPPSHPNEG
jgi:hypothetical protein